MNDIMKIITLMATAIVVATTSSAFANTTVLNVVQDETKHEAMCLDAGDEAPIDVQNSAFHSETLLIGLHHLSKCNQDKGISICFSADTLTHRTVQVFKTAEECEKAKSLYTDFMGATSVEFVDPRKK